MYVQRMREGREERRKRDREGGEGEGEGEIERRGRAGEREMRWCRILLLKVI